MRTLFRSTAASAVVLITALAIVTQAQTAPKVTTPQQQFGHEIGADYVLPNYTQLTEYWRKLDRESDRMTVVTIGKTAEGRDQLMAIVTAPENHKKIDRYKEISRRLALAEGLTDEQARSLAAEGKAVVWIDGGLHATEVLGAQQLAETVYRYVSGADPDTMRVLRDVVILFVHANPDGMELVSDWYMREKDPKKRSTSGIPRLYQKYIGHDNNRDFYLSSQAETTNMNRVMYLEWFPQIVYNHHQTGPTGTVLFAPPFRDPFNYNFDPLVVTGIDVVGNAIHHRFIAEGKPGATRRRGANYSTWFNGGLRTTSYFHNMIGILTETIGNPTPIQIPFVPQRQLPNEDLPFPIAPQQTWHFRQSIEYSVTANNAILDLASRYREQFLFNIYQMGRNSIQRGSRDTWTITPTRLDAVMGALDQKNRGEPFNPAGTTGGFSATTDRKYFDEILRNPASRDARGYVIPSDQADFPTAVKFVNALIKTGVLVDRAKSSFQAAGKTYPAGSYVVRTAQAFRPHVLDMFEPQDHPNDFNYPGGPPTPPYDNAGYTLAYQMGVRFDRVLDKIEGPFERVSGLQKPPAGRFVTGTGDGYLLSHAPNDAFIVINRLLKAGESVYWAKETTKVGDVATPGAIFVAGKPSTGALLQNAAKDLGLSFHSARRPGGDVIRLRPVRIALWDQYGGSMPSGWIRWLFEQFEFPFEVVYAPQLDADGLRAKYDVIVFPDEALQFGEATGPFVDSIRGRPESVPEEYRDRIGTVSVAKTIPELRRFVQEGGTIIAIGSSSRALARELDLPVGDALVERTAAGERPLPREKFYVPGSVLRVAVDNTHPVAYGLSSSVDVMFDQSPVFRLKPSAALQRVRAVAWFDSPTSLRSGWAWGQHYLDGGVAAVEASLGRGHVYLFGPEITFRAQPHGTFKFLFNAIYYGAAEGHAAASTDSANGR